MKYIVIGLGNYGGVLAEELSMLGNEIIGVDCNSHQVELLKDKMAVLAKALGMKVMLGCMTETSCAVTAAAQLSPMVDWADLDGNLLIANDKFDGIKIVNGKVTIPDRPGIGVLPIE